MSSPPSLNVRAARARQLRVLLRASKKRHPTLSPVKRKDRVAQELADARHFLENTLKLYTPEEARSVLYFVQQNRSPIAQVNRLMATLVNVYTRVDPSRSAEAAQTIEIILAMPVKLQQKIHWLDSMRYTYPDYFHSQKQLSDAHLKSVRKNVLRSLFLSNFATLKELRADARKKKKKVARLRQSRKLLEVSRPVERSPLEIEISELHQTLAPLLSKVSSSNQLLAQNLARMAESYVREKENSKQVKDAAKQAYYASQKSRCIQLIRDLLK